MMMFPKAEKAGKTEDDSSLIEKALSAINSGKYHEENNVIFLEAIMVYIATSDKRSDLVQTLKSHVDSLKMNNQWKIKRLIKDVEDSAYCEAIRKHPKFANYSIDTFKTEINTALGQDFGGDWLTVTQNFKR